MYPRSSRELLQRGVCGCDRFSSGSIRDVIETIVKKDGYGGLMRGWIPRMLSMHQLLQSAGPPMKQQKPSLKSRMAVVTWLTEEPQLCLVDDTST
ncbi:hypothetical protein CK203_063569 [Vitis vinifera]|uniref:Uncharacterized protein n=1 Tax=Vitis vinifera TaxID=29760 RepID=A0A438GC22_VITVI|nr:hypothetical protein CK203_063569 [Vitis vinifera]